ncbi:MAG: aminopeptidase [Thermofilum sp. ex4484_79]|nr:MAG: aminopeptidase [Thermofilum sp. ex4484_79]
MFERKIAWEVLDREAIEKFAKEYIHFIGNAKTEREVVEYLIEIARKNGFVELDDMENLKPGDKVFSVFKNKTVIFAVIGKKSLKEGLRIIAAHADAPRLDPKIVPLMEDKDSQLALLNMGYYGGIVAYQWVNIPLELRGIVVTKNGSKRIRIKNLVIADLLPHLSRKKFEERKASDTVKGEELKILLANIPTRDENKKKSWKKTVLKILSEKYGIDEEDLISADLEVVPALEPIEVGLDSSMIAAYGQDDRVCIYTAFRALIDSGVAEYTKVLWIVDREEIGSETNTSAQSEFFKFLVSKLLEKSGGYSEITLRETLLNSKAISADVGAVVNPSFKSAVYDLSNAARLGSGVLLEKYLNAAGKGGENEAHAEFVGWVRRILDENNVPWQPALLVSKTERVGGGGTISKFMARLGMDVIDIGVGLLGMHSPFEIASKADIYAAYRAYKVFYEAR